MNIVAILAIRNERVCLANCLRHLVRNGVDFAIIDQQSDDGSSVVYRSSEFSRHLVGVFQSEYAEEFSLRAQLEDKMRVIEGLGADWVIHLDADEMMHSNNDNETLHQSITRLAAEGYNVINFDEFVFLPVDRDYPSGVDGYPPLHFYYFFEPQPQRLMRAWLKADNFSPIQGGGHTLNGAPARIAPESLALRHYMVQSQAHALTKYMHRRFASSELADGWHRQRANQPESAFLFPPPERLKHLNDPASHRLDRTDPWKVHYWRPGAWA